MSPRSLADSARPTPRVSPPSPWYSCGRCASGPHSADMTASEARTHARMVHNAVILPARTQVLALKS